MAFDGPPLKKTKHRFALRDKTREIYQCSRCGLMRSPNTERGNGNKPYLYWWEQRRGWSKDTAGYCGN